MLDIEKPGREIQTNIKPSPWELDKNVGRRILHKVYKKVQHSARKIISKYLNIDCITQPLTSFIFISTWTRWRRWAKRSSNSVFGQVASYWWSWLSWWSQPPSSSSSSQSPSPTRSWRWHHRLQLPRVVLRRCVIWDQKLVMAPNLTSRSPLRHKGKPVFQEVYLTLPK